MQRFGVLEKRIEHEYKNTLIVMAIIRPIISFIDVAFRFRFQFPIPDPIANQAAANNQLSGNLHANDCQ